jgi:hypothetical protein
MFKSNKNDTVLIAYPHPNQVAHSWTHSLIQMYDFDSGHKKRIGRGGWLCGYADSGRIVSARNKLVKDFLNTDADWLFWIDTDMGFESDSLERLIEVADPEVRPIVGGLCFGQKVVAQDGLGGQKRKSYPTILKLVEENGFYSTAPATIYPVNQLIECDATGAAFVLVHRSVFQAFENNDWYEEIFYKNNISKFGEDISFCVRAKELGFNTFVHTGVKTNHLKEQWISETEYWQDLQSLDFDIEVTVLTACVSAKDFLHAGYLAKSLKRTTGNAKLTIAINKIDIVNQFWIDGIKSKFKELDIIEVNCQHFPEMINNAILQLNTEWIVVTKPSIKFEHGWLDNALTVASFNKHAFIGFNDNSEPCLENIFSPVVLVNKTFVNDQFYDTRFKHFWQDALVLKMKKTSLWSMALNAQVKNTEKLPEVSEEIISHDYSLLKELL